MSRETQITNLLFNDSTQKCQKEVPTLFGQTSISFTPLISKEVTEPQQQYERQTTQTKQQTSLNQQQQQQQQQNKPRLQLQLGQTQPPKQKAQRKAELPNATRLATLYNAPHTDMRRSPSPVLRSPSPVHKSQTYIPPRPTTSATARSGTPGNKGQQTVRRTELELARRDLEQMKFLVETLQRQVEEDTEQIRTLNGEKEHLTNELENARDHIGVLERQRRGLAEDLEEQKRLVAALQQSEAALKDEVERLQRKIAAMEDEHRRAQEAAERRIAAITEDAQRRQKEAEALIASLQATIKDLQGQIVEQQAKMLQMQKDKEAEQIAMDAILREGERERMRLHNAMQEMKGNIRVFCRVRPLISHDHEYREMATYDAEPRSLAARRASATVPGMQYISFPDRADHRCVTIAVPGGEGLTGGEKEMKDYQFQFDKVFEPSDSQDQVFEEIQQLVQSALDGYKVCIFAYGQTGSGKTYTMEGPSMQAIEKDPSLQGMIPRSVEQVFLYSQKMRERGWDYALSASFVEIYNEQIRDLLNKDDQYQDGPNAQDGRCRHEIRNCDGYTVLTGVTEVPVKDARTVHNLLSIATRNRKSSMTAMNDRASRSHSVFTLKIVGTHEGSQQQVLGVLNLIDLAGSERVGLSGAQGDRLKEAAAINKSLSCLGDVIVALAKGDNHVPFRNSKLTHMLQPYMGNESKTLMFVNVSPSELFLSESLNSLRFAAKVNACEIGLAKRKVSFKK